jgi:stress-induced-phosphoprotein 1
MSKIMAELQSQRAGETDAETYERAVRDPEVAQILNDPVMRQLLQDSQQDPRALQEHMKNPMVSFCIGLRVLRLMRLCFRLRGRFRS